MQEVIVEARRRQWPKEVKRRIVAETLEPNVTVCEVARRHDIPPSQLFQWRRALKDQIKVPEPTSFIPVSVAPDATPSVMPVVDDRIELVLRNGRRLTVPLSFDAKRLGRLANILESS